MTVLFQVGVRRTKCKGCQRTLGERQIQGPDVLAWGFCNDDCEITWRKSLQSTADEETKVLSVDAAGFALSIAGSADFDVLTPENAPLFLQEYPPDVELNRVPTRTDREGDSQPLPTRNGNPHIHELVKADLHARMVIGTERYGTPLQAHNGRNPLLDAYEEILDLAVYMKQRLVEEGAGEVRSTDG